MDDPYVASSASYATPEPSRPVRQNNTTRVDSHLSPFGAVAHASTSAGPLEQYKHIGGGQQQDGIGKDKMLQNFSWYSSAAATPYADSNSFSSGL